MPHAFDDSLEGAGKILVVVDDENVGHAKLRRKGESVFVGYFPEKQDSCASPLAGLCIFQNNQFLVSGFFAVLAVKMTFVFGRSLEGQPLNRP